MLLPLLLCSLSVSVAGQQAQQDWVDPYDMLNYDAGTKSMRHAAQPSSYDNVNTKRREHIHYPQQDESQIKWQADKQLNPFDKIHYDSGTGTMRKPAQSIEPRKETQEPECNPVLKRFFRRLLKDIKTAGEPEDSSEVIYSAKIKLTKQALVEIQRLLDGEDWDSGALDNAISQILVDLRLHSHVPMIWRFEDTFGVELDTVIKISLFILIVVAIICTHLWSFVSWFVRFRRLFAVSFFISIIWNWLYLYKIAFAEHQNNLVKMDNFNAKCTGVKKIDWSDSLKEWFRRTWTLQDDPCQTFYEVLMVNPILLVPPSKAITMTITTFFTDPLKHIGQGISEFLRELLKDLPVTLQIPVLIIVMLVIVICMYGSVQAAFQHGIMAPLRRPRGDPPPEALHQRAQRLEHIGACDAQAPLPQPVHEPAHLPAEEHAHERRANSELPSNHIQHVQPRSVRPKDMPARMVVETVRKTEDGTDAKQREKKTQELDPSTVSDSEKQQETKHVKAESTNCAAGDTVKTKAKEPDSMKSNKKAKKEETNLSQGKPSGDGAAETQERQSEVQELGAANEQIENVGISVQETSSVE